MAETYPGGVFSSAIIVAALITQYVLPDENLDVWMAFVKTALRFAECSIVLKVSSLAMVEAVRRHYKIDFISDLMTYIAVNAGVVGYIIRGYQHAMVAHPIDAYFQFTGLDLIGLVLLASNTVVLFGGKLAWMVE